MFFWVRHVQPVKHNQNNSGFVVQLTTKYMEKLIPAFESFLRKKKERVQQNPTNINNESVLTLWMQELVSREMGWKRST